MLWIIPKIEEMFDRFLKRKLKVPYILQINENACGAAVLEMVYRYYGLNDISQEDIFNKYKEHEPYGSGNFRITVDNIVSDAKERGFSSFWNRINCANHKDAINTLKRLTMDLRIPVIVCQKFTEEQPLIGHFRIVVGIKNNIVYVHDPHVSNGGKDKEWVIERFMEFWQPTGENVTGGVYVVIKNKKKRQEIF